MTEQIMLLVLSTFLSILSAVLVGLILLYFEYKTNWFMNNVPQSQKAFDFFQPFLTWFLLNRMCVVISLISFAAGIIVALLSVIFFQPKFLLNLSSYNVRPFVAVTEQESSKPIRQKGSYYELQPGTNYKFEIVNPSEVWGDLQWEIVPEGLGIINYNRKEHSLLADYFTPATVIEGQNRAQIKVLDCDVTGECRYLNLQEIIVVVLPNGTK